MFAITTKNVSEITMKNPPTQKPIAQNDLEKEILRLENELGNNRTQEERLFVLHHLAIMYNTTGEHEKAIQKNKEILSSPGCTREMGALAHNEITISYYMLGEKTNALYHLSQGLNLEPENYTLLSNCVKMGGIEKILGHMNLQIDSNNKTPGVYFWRGLAHCHLGAYEAAVEDFAEALRVNEKYLTHIKDRNKIKLSLEDLRVALSDYCQCPPEIDKIFILFQTLKCLSLAGADPEILKNEYREALKDYDESNFARKRKRAALAQALNNSLEKSIIETAPVYQIIAPPWEEKITNRKHEKTMKKIASLKKLLAKNSKNLRKQLMNLASLENKTRENNRKMFSEVPKLPDEIINYQNELQLPG